MPRLIPVIDVLHGVVVRGIGGRRREYQPIRSCLTSSTDPAVVAQAVITAFRPAEMYIADLDAILGQPSTLQTLPTGCDYWVDAGVRTLADAAQIAARGWHVVLGLETLDCIDTVARITGQIGSDRLIFSLDLKDGTPLRLWPNMTTPHEIIAAVVDAGLRRVIVLDLAFVGGGQGTGTKALLHDLMPRYPDVEWISGGGITTADAFHAEPTAAVLVASALHDGRITWSDT